MQGAEKVKCSKYQWPNKEMGKRTKQSFLKGRTKIGQKSHEVMLIIPGHNGNVAQNHTKIPLYSF
jgi:hypothetical protein